MKSLKESEILHTDIEYVTKELCMLQQKSNEEKFSTKDKVNLNIIIIITTIIGVFGGAIAWAIDISNGVSVLDTKVSQQQDIYKSIDDKLNTLINKTK